MTRPDPTSAAQALLADLTQLGLVAVIRGTDGDRALRTGRALMAAGVTILEVTLTTPGAAAAITTLRGEATEGTWVGAGTVLTAADVAEARAAGAMFTVTPGLCEGVDAAVAAGLPVISGAWTASEVFDAHRRGAVAVKVFPISSGGPAHIAALRGPFPDIPLIGVGGVGLDDVPPLRRAGAIAVGVGGPLTGRGAGDDPATIATRAHDYLKACQA